MISGKVFCCLITEKGKKKEEPQAGYVGYENMYLDDKNL